MMNVKGIKTFTVTAMIGLASVSFVTNANDACINPVSINTAKTECVVKDNSYWVPDKLVIKLSSECTENVFVQACLRNGSKWSDWQCNAIHLSNNEVWESKVKAELVWYEWAWEKVEPNAC